MLSIDSKIKELMKDEEAVAIIEEFRPGLSTDPKLEIIIDSTLRYLLGRAKEAGFMTDEQIAEIDARLQAIEE